MFYFCVKENTKYKIIIYKSSQIKVQSIEHLKNIILNSLVCGFASFGQFIINSFDFVTE